MSLDDSDLLRLIRRGYRFGYQMEQTVCPEDTLAIAGFCKLPWDVSVLLDNGNLQEPVFNGAFWRDKSGIPGWVIPDAM